MAYPSSISRSNVHFWIYYLSLSLFVVSLSTSRFLLTVSIVLLGVNWLVEGNFKDKYHRFCNQKAAGAFLLMFGLSLLGILWAHDRMFALQSLHHKLPTLLLPLVLLTSPALSKKQIVGLLVLFTSSVVVVSFIGLGIRLVDNSVDFREASPFVPATNFSMLLIVAAFQLPILVRQISSKRIHLYLSLAVSGWLVFFIVYLRSFTGLASLGGALGYTLLIILLYHKSRWLKAAFAAGLIGVVGFLVWLFLFMYNLTHSQNDIDFNNLPRETSYGSEYKHDVSNPLRENGNLVYVLIADEELRDAWNVCSTVPFDSLTRSNESLKHTLYRYMASMGLPKDKEGLSKLSKADIVAVEDGYTNYLFLEWPGLYNRVYQLMMGIYMYTSSNGASPSWSTFTERFALWEASLESIKTRPVFGWGTGHVERAVEYGLSKNGSVLAGNNLRSHNQYLSLMLLWGVLGFTAFLAIYIYIVMRCRVYRVFPFTIFLIVFAINGLVNDPIEGQIGQSMFIFFTLFYCYIYPKLGRAQSLFSA